MNVGMLGNYNGYEGHMWDNIKKQGLKGQGISRLYKALAIRPNTEPELHSSHLMDLSGTDLNKGCHNHVIVS